MEDLIMKNTNCPECNHHMEYWTKSGFIECMKCKNMIEVEPCEEATEIIDEVKDEEIIEEE